MKTITCQIIKEGRKEALILRFNNKVILANIYKDWEIDKILGISPVLIISSYEDYNKIPSLCQLDADFEDTLYEYVANYLDKTYISQHTHIETFKDERENINALLIVVNGCAMVYAPNKNINKLRYLQNYYSDVEFCFNDYSINNWLYTYVLDIRLHQKIIEEIFCFERMN